MYLLDTNVISELRKAGNGTANRHVVHWAASVPTASLYISPVTILEIETGILQIERHAPDQAALLRDWLENHVLAAFENRILPIDETVIRQCARLHPSDPKPERDALIAATALIHRMTLVTRNIGDFGQTGVKLLDPWHFATDDTSK